jgi:hypothetical protein
MPVRPVYRNRKVTGYRYGLSGTLYLVSKYGMRGARAKAQAQARAIFASGYKKR